MSAPGTPPGQPAERGVLPRIARPSAGLSTMGIAIAAIIVGGLLFTVLEARRSDLAAPAVRPARADLLATSAAPPPLYIPPQLPPTYAVRIDPEPPVQPAPIAREVAAAAPAPPPPADYTPPPYVAPPAPAAPPRTAIGAILVVDASQPQSGDRPAPAGEAAPRSGFSEVTARSRAGTISNRQTTVPQGTLIPAVLETAFNSTGSGYARALVQRDVRGFDGSRILIPRGSRLIGEYASDTSPGQKRAFVTWTRLIRPDGVTIALGSPATDPVGVGGVRAKVDSHFFERFAGSILQSAMLIGGNLAARSAGDSVVVALPGSFSGSEVTTPATQIPPTLSIRQGTSISVFVARDLDFTAVETPR